MMSDFTAVTVVFLAHILHTSYSQFPNDVIYKGATCESKYGYKDCLESKHCLTKFLRECECLPKAARNLFTLPVDGKLLCM